MLYTPTPTENANATAFWQLIADTGYLIEGENRAFEREQLTRLNQHLDKWFADRPEIFESRALDHFAMHAVHRLVGAFVFNDQCGANEPDFRERLFQLVNNHTASLERAALSFSE
jgi:hypothetical protein